MKKTPIILAIAAIAIFALGFFAGSEYTKYKVRSTLEKAFSPTKTPVAEIKPENIITKGVGEEIQLTTLKFTIHSSEEKNVLQDKYSAPQVADAGTKFIVIDTSLTNITNEPFTFFNDFVLIDNKDRKFTKYENVYGSQYLHANELSPNIAERGFLVFQVPTDAESYSLLIGKAGTDEIYKVTLK